MPGEGWTNDPELIGEMVAESREHLAAAEVALLALEGRFDLDSVGVAFRAFHTIKGSCGLLGLDGMGAFAHVVEELLGKLRAGSLAYTPAAASLALRSVDALRGCVDGIVVHALRGEQVALTPEMHRLVDELNGFADGFALFSDPPAAPPPVTPAAPPAGPVNDGWTRVRTDRLDQLNEMVGELVVAQAMVEKTLQDLAADRGEDARRNVSRATKIVRELQSRSLALRMVPMRQTFQRLARVARDVSQRTHKRVCIVMKGEDTELDRNLVERIADPLVHMVRNAIDHGIEDASVRAERGKPGEGTITLSASHIGEELVLELSDDGQGSTRTAYEKWPSSAASSRPRPSSRTRRRSRCFSCPASRPGMRSRRSRAEASGWTS